MKRLIFLRHTKTAFNSEPQRLRGGLDVPLSREGFASIPDVVDQFKVVYPDVKAIYCSPLSRASILATALAHEYSIVAEKCEALASWNYGVLNGRYVSDVVNILKVISAGLGRDLAPEGGESMNHFLRRLTVKIKDIVASAPENGVVVIVSHLQNLLLSRQWLRLGLPEDVTLMPYEYEEVNEVAPGSWFELRQEWAQN